MQLGSLSPNDVEVQLYIGPLDPQDNFIDAHTIKMNQAEQTASGTWQFVGETSSPQSGRYGFSVRVLPSNQAMTHPFELRMIRWPSAQLAQMR